MVRFVEAAEGELDEAVQTIDRVTHFPDAWPKTDPTLPD